LSCKIKIRKGSCFDLITITLTCFAFFIACPQSLAAEIKNSASETTLLKSALHDFDLKNYNEAFTLFKKAAPNDVSGTADSVIAIMSWERLIPHVHNVSNAKSTVFWGKKALPKIRSNALRKYIITFMSDAYNDIGVAHAKQHNYVVAFQYYKKAAKMGCADGQYNLGVLYAAGRGTIQDYKKAYAWISVGIAVGLNRKNDAVATKIQSGISQYLYAQGSLSKAKNLAKKYYKLYVPNVSP